MQVIRVPLVHLAIASAVLAVVLSSACLPLTDDQDTEVKPGLSTPTADAQPSPVDEQPEDVLKALSLEYQAGDVVDALIHKNDALLISLTKKKPITCVKGSERSGHLCAHLKIPTGTEATVDTVLLSITAHVVVSDVDARALLATLFSGDEAEVLLVGRDHDRIQVAIEYPQLAGSELSGLLFVDARLSDRQPINVLSFEPADSDIDALDAWRQLETIGQAVPLVAVDNTLIDAERDRHGQRVAPDRASPATGRSVE